jgi:hypothetical protein
VNRASLLRRAALQHRFRLNLTRWVVKRNLPCYNEHVSAPKCSKTKRGGNGFLREASNLPGNLEKLRQRLLDYRADAEFERLTKSNCDPQLLLCLLDGVREIATLDTWQGHFGLRGPRQLESVANRMRKCAEEFEKADRNGFLRLAAWPRFKDEFTPTQFLDRLSRTPALLRACADALVAAATNPRFRPRARGFSNTALAQLVAYVLHCTGAPHDAEVSALLGAVGKVGRDSDPYTADALKTWRTEHASFIQHAGQMFPSLFGR